MYGSVTRTGASSSRGKSFSGYGKTGLRSTEPENAGEVARQVVELRASPELDSQIQELGRKCNAGQLTAAERADYETISRYVKFISVLQSKARAMLKDDAID